MPDLTTLFTETAKAIRTMDGTTDKIVASDFPDRIKAIPQGITPTGSITITTNGTHTVTNYATAVVNVPTNTPTGTKTITANGTYDVTNYASAVVKITSKMATGTVKYSAKTTTVTINTGLEYIDSFSLTAYTTPSESWTLDSMAWNSATGLGAASVYRGSWSAGYGQDGFTVTASGGTITLTTNATENLGLAANTTYRWMAYGD